MMLQRAYFSSAMILLFGLLGVVFQPEPASANGNLQIADSTKPKSENDESAPAIAEKPTEPVNGTETPADGESAETVVSSFDPIPQDTKKPVPANTEAPKPAIAATEAQDGPRKLSFNFRFAPWSDVLKLFADTAHLTLDLNDVPPGTFNYYDAGTYTPTEALDVLNGYLLQKGYILVRRDQFLVVLNIDDGIPPNLVPNVTLAELPRRGRNELLSVVLPLEGIEAEDAAKEAEALLGPQGKVVAMSTSNSLVATDIGSNLMRIHRLLENATVKADPGSLSFRAFPLKHIPASDAERIVRNLLGLSQSVPNVSAGASYSRFGDLRSRSSDPRSRYSAFYRYDPRFGGSSSSRSALGSSTGRAKTQVTADPRTNSLLVTGTAVQLQLVEDAVQAIDVEEDSSGRPLAANNNAPQLKVYEVKTADPREVAKTLEALVPGVVINEDAKARKIHIFATPDEHREIELLIRQLDGLGGGRAVAVIPLIRLDPVSAGGTLRSLFAGDGDNAPTIEADVLGRRLMVRGTADQIAQVKTVLAQLGEDGTGGFTDDPRFRGPVRTLSLGGRDPQAFLQLLEKFWSASNPNPIRVVIPAQVNPIHEQRTPSEEGKRKKEKGKREETRTERPNGLHAAGESRDDLFWLSTRDSHLSTASHAASTVPISIVNQTEPKDGEVKQPETKPEQEPPAETAAKTPVTISVSGGNLVISSSDLEALDRMEKLIETLAMAVPARTTWTVFYLRTADATEAAVMLEQLFPSSSVSTSTGGDASGLLGGLTSGISSFGRSLVDLTGLSDLGSGPQTLRIIPEARSNSLFVAGPPDKVRDVEQFLKILDASELPESLRDRVPRMIPVEYADVNDVAAIVKDVYKDAMGTSTGNAAAGRGVNPIAMLMGAAGGNKGGNQQKGRQATPIRLTLGVDTRTNQLIVSSSEMMFKQIEELVESLDRAAQEAQRTVRVVRLENAEAVSVQQALSSLIPNVKVSVTGGAKPQTQPAGGPPGRPSVGSSGPPPEARPSPDDIRRFFEQRIRERMEQQQRGGGRSPQNSRSRPGVRPGGGRALRRGGRR